MLVIIMVGPVLSTAVPPVAAQASSDPWWGPSVRDDPTQGWAVRVPLVVENTFTYGIRDSIARAEIDFRALLVDAGWTTQSAYATTLLRGFTLDVDSIRVVPYGPNFSPGPLNGRDTKPTPHITYGSPLEGKCARSTCDPASDALVTVLFVVDGFLASGAKRYYYVYANPLEYGKTPPAEFKPEDRAPLDSFLWGTTGTLFYGYEPLQNNNLHALRVMTLTSQPTTVRTYEYDVGGRFAPVPDRPQLRNPLQLGGSNPASASLAVSAGKAFKIESTAPIVVMGHGVLNSLGASVESFGYFPSSTGSYRGTQFDAYGFDGGPTTSSQLWALKVASGTVSVSGGGSSILLTNAEPFKRLEVPGGTWHRILASGDILLAMRGANGPDNPVHSVQVPATTGGPSGTTFIARAPADGGFLHACPEARTAIRVVESANPDFQLVPEGPRETTPPEFVTPSPGCEVLELPGTAPTSATGYLEAFAIGEETRYPVENAPVPFTLVTGAEGRANPSLERRFVGHFGGVGATEFHVMGRTGIFGYFNDTRITVTLEREDGTNETSQLSVGRDKFQPLKDPREDDKTMTGRYRIEASKPISVVSTEAAILDGADHSYSRFVPGLPPNVQVTIGAAEFRGPLVELRSAEKPDARFDFRTTGPDTPVAYTFELLNAGRWIGGETLLDTLTLTCTGPTEWRIDGCDREFSIPSGTAERFTLTVTPTAEDVNSTSRITIRAASKTPGIFSEFQLSVRVQIVYGVGMWFDVENGRKTIDPIVGVDPGETHDYNVVIKNTGSTRDTFRLTVDAPKEGWTQQLTHERTPITEITLGPAESAVMRFAVTAPNLETAPQNLVSITAESVSSDLASAKDIVNTATRIRPNINIKLTLDPPTRVAEPAQPATFNVTVENRGNDIFRIIFREDSVLPAGWNASLAISEIDLGPGEPYTFPLAITPPQGARAGDLATLKLSAETDVGGGGARIPGDEISAVVVVKRIHNITTPALIEARTGPGVRLDYVLPLENHGNGDDVVELLPGAVSEWPLRALEPVIVLGLGEEADLPLAFDVPSGAAPGLHNVNVTLRLSREATQTILVPVQVEAVARADIQGITRLDAAPGRSVQVPLTVENVGNLPANFTLGADAPEGWNVTYVPASVSLSPGESRRVDALVNASRLAEDGDYDVTLTARIAEADAGNHRVPVRVARPALYIASVETSGDLSPGELIIVSAVIGNRGAIAAENVKVALVVDDAVVDQVTLQRVTVGESQVATLNWLATQRGGDVRVVIDPDNALVLQASPETEATVNFGSGLPIPAPSGVLAALVMLAAALFVARRWRA